VASRFLAVVALLIATACGPDPESDPAAIHAAARQALLEGRLEAAGELTTRGLALAGDTSANAAALRLLNAEILLMRRDVRGASRAIDAPLPQGPQFDGLEARRRYLVGYREMMSARFEQAAATLEDAVARATRAGATDVALDADILAGQALFRMGTWDEAEKRLVRARELARSVGDRAREAGALGNLGMGQRVRERFDAGLTYFEQILEFRQLETHLSYATALSNAGLCLARLGELDRALELQTRAVELLESRNVPLYLEQALGELGHTQFLRGDAAAAVELLTRARRVAAASGRSSDEALWTDSTATALIELGRWSDAERLNEESIALKKRATGAALGPNLVNRGQIAAGRGDHAGAVAGFSAALAEPDALPWVLWEAHAGAAMSLMRMEQTSRAMRHFEGALDIVQDTRSGLVRPEHRISFLSRKIDFYRAYVDALVQTGRTEQALEVADASRAQVLAERFGVAPEARSTAASFVRRARQADAVIASYWLAPVRSFVWMVSSSGVHLAELPPAAVIDGLVAAHRTFIERTLGDPRRTSSAPGDALAAAVLAPVLPHVPKGGRVVVVPDGSLHGVNFETLPVGKDRRYWIEDTTVVLAPSLAMIGPRVATSRPGARALLLIGDPSPPDGALSRLQFAAEEVAAVRTAFPPSAVVVRQGADASPAAFLDAPLETFSTIHFAAHATTSGLSPLDSAIELSPGENGSFKLYARDVAQRRLRADLVSISSCRSAGDRAYGGEGLVGLAWAFLRAGATNVIAGLWDVDDQSTAALMTDTYVGLRAGHSPADALRAAKLRMIARGGNFSKPYYWAPFQVFTAAR
jgi:CHAT domain-containing protein/Tfp pilus assembly protein PilF